MTPVIVIRTGAYAKARHERDPGYETNERKGTSYSTVDLVYRFIGTTQIYNTLLMLRICKEL
jgi:hypothetical protein